MNTILSDQQIASKRMIGDWTLIEIEVITGNYNRRNNNSRYYQQQPKVRSTQNNNPTNTTKKKFM